MGRRVWTVVIGMLFLRAYGANDTGSEDGFSGRVCGMTIFGSGVITGACNPAELGVLRHWSAGLFAENRFLLKELMKGSAGFGIPIRRGGIGIDIQYFGCPLYHETEAGISCGLQLAKRFRAGIRIGYRNDHTGEGYGSVHRLIAEAGAVYGISDRLEAGFHLINPFSITFNSSPRERLPAIYRLGLEWRPLPVLVARVEAEKESMLPVALKGAIGYRVTRPFTLWLGCRTGPVSFTFGAEMRIGKLMISAGTSYDLILGFSPWMGLEVGGR